MPDDSPVRLPVEKPGPIGRAGRILFGMLLGVYAIYFLGGWVATIRGAGVSWSQAAYTGVVQKGNLAFWAMTLLSIYWFPLGSRRVRLAGGAIAIAAAVGLDYVLAGDWWGLPLAAAASAMIAITFCYSGAFLHLVAGITANPG